MLLDSEAVEVQFCDAQLKPLIVERRVPREESSEDRIEFGVMVSVAVTDDQDVVLKGRDSVETVRNLLDTLLESEWC